MATQLRTTEGNKVQEFVCLKIFEKLAKKRVSEMNKEQREPDEQTVCFAADQSIKSFLLNLKVFGKVTCQLSSLPKSRLAEKEQPKTPVDILPKPTLYKITKQKEIDMKLQEDTNDCSIWGSCITDGGFLLLVDNKNFKLKRLDMTTETITDYLSFIYWPYAVCQVSKTEAAVSLYNNTVQFVLLDDQMSATRTLSFHHFCWGLAHHNGKLFISDCDTSVYIHDMIGKELKKITNASILNIFRRPIFSNNRHIAVSADGSRVFVTDLEKGLITLDIRGKYLSTLSWSDIQTSSCWGVCTDGSNVFVSGLNSHNVVQIGQDHKLLGQIATNGPPTSVCFDSRKRRLYVTKGERNDVSVLELV